MNLLPLFMYTVKAFNILHEPAVVTDYTNCLTQLIEYNFKESGDISMFSAKNHNMLLSRIKSEVLKKLSDKPKYYVEIVYSTNEEALREYHQGEVRLLKLKHHEDIPSVKYYLIITENYKELFNIIEQIICTHNWTPTAKFMILISDFSCDDESRYTLERIFTYLFQCRVLKVVIILPDVKDIRDLIVYSWRPLDPPKYCGNFNETAKNRLFVENVCVHGKTKHKRDLFDYVIPSDMKGCVIKVLALEKQPFVSENENDPNIEMNLVNAMLAQFNFKTNYQNIRGYRGEREKDGNWSGALNLLTSKQGQLLLGGIYPDYDVHQDFECSTTYLVDSYTWVVPRASSLPAWQSLIIIFKKTVWYFITGTFIISVLSWKILGKLSNDSANNQNLLHCFINAFITSVGFSSYARPNNHSLRIFYIFFNMYCLLLLTIYQTKLISVLQNPTFEYQMQSTKELVTSKLKFGGLEQLHDLFDNSIDPIDSYIKEKWIDVIDIRKALVDVAVHKNFSLLCSRMELAHFEMIMPELKNKYGHNSYYAFQKNVFTVPVEFIALNGFAFMPKFSKMLDLFKQMGINMAVRRRLNLFYMRKEAKLRDKKSTFRALTMYHLQGGFLVLIIGYISGVVIIFIENLNNV